MTFDIINPESLGAPKGWNNGMLAPAGGRILFIAGQTGRDASHSVPHAPFADQFGLALKNILAVLKEAGGKPRDIGRMTIFVTDLDAYQKSLRTLGQIYRDQMGRHYPAMSLVRVSELVDDNAVVEIEATAVLPPKG